MKDEDIIKVNNNMALIKEVFKMTFMKV